VCISCVPYVENLPRSADLLQRDGAPRSPPHSPQERVLWLHTTQNKRRVRVLGHGQLPFVRPLRRASAPAPITTLDRPLHSDQKPSARDIVTMALEMPLYMALGDGLTICMRVCGRQRMAYRRLGGGAADGAYLEQIYGIHDRVFLERRQRGQAHGGRAAVAHGNACERAGKHVRSEGEVGRQCFIAMRRSAAGDALWAVDSGAGRTRVLLR